MLDPPVYQRPFADASADIIFCSSDHVCFKLHKLVLMLASAFFKDMFSLPQPFAGLSPLAGSAEEPAKHDGLPVVHVAEPGTVLEGLFRLCYPIRDPPLDTLEEVRPLLEAALKYQMQEAVEITTRRLRELAPSAPLRVYAVACRLSLQDVMRVAAQAVFDQKLTEAYVNELEELPVSDYRRLLWYCFNQKQTAPDPSAFSLAFDDAARSKCPPQPQTADELRKVLDSSDMFAGGSTRAEIHKVVIQMSDGQTVELSEDMLRLFSPVLAQDVSKTSPPAGSPPVLTVPESSAVILLLLMMCHPLAAMPAIDPSELPFLLDAAEKYQMKKPIYILREQLSNLKEDSSVDSAWLYFVACHFRLRSLAQASALRCLRRDLASERFPNVDFSGVTAGTFWRLLDYQRRCRAATRALIDADPATWMSGEWQKKTRCGRWDDCQACWLSGLMQAVRKMPWPSSADLRQEAVMEASISSSLCSNCQRPRSIVALFGFISYVSETIQKRVNELPLDSQAGDPMAIPLPVVRRPCPLFSHSSADVVFCSADHVNFKLHKIILALASEFFEDMFAIPQPVMIEGAGRSEKEVRREELDGLPVVHVTEPSTVLEGLFRLCYPMEDPPLATVDEVRVTLEAAMKYEMREAIGILTRRLIAQAETEPLRVFSIGYCFSLDDVVSTAARAVCTQKVQDSYVKELEEIPVHVYRRLLSWCDGGGTSSFKISESKQKKKSRKSQKPLFESFTEDIACTTLTPRMSSLFEAHGADLLIHTADGAEFGVSKDILRLASPVLYEQLASTPTDESDSPRPIPEVIVVPESSDVMRILLNACYPVAPLQVASTDLSVIVHALAAAEKYGMDKAVWQLRTCLTLLEHEPAVDPVALYFVACRFSLRELARTAAKKTLRKDLISGSVSFPDVDAFSGVSAGHLWRLLDYHRRCRAAVRSMVDDSANAWMSEEWKTNLRVCKAPYNYVGLKTVCWLPRYMSALQRKAWPNSADAGDEAVLAESMNVNDSLKSSSTCYDSTCQKAKGFMLLYRFSKYVAETLEARENEVTLEWKEPEPKADSKTQTSAETPIST
ncbi:hypothetical protein BN946_scf185008.g80 [Trametes cinnabarina]|uniref:BTB domain-containing protein n=1 Tax=Pycnoporus cinnabarinus TaxID=5643 RepID=A0A060SLN2_PYCCI|nr:hypothetical protein BN946_scf185008.g80 [Trametes cinnabarina]